VFEKKKNGIFQAHLCVLGYSQILGIDYSEHFAPAVNDITLHLVLLKWLMKPQWKAKVYDVETAFLYGDPEEPIYMQIPRGLEHFVSNIHPQEDWQFTCKFQEVWNILSATLVHKKIVCC
jgi:Reverse transcriptase (RNA-dependent DNA polymerase)